MKIEMIGKENCTICESVKSYLEGKKVAFKYIKIETYDKTIKNQIIQEALDRKITEFPLVYVDDNLITINELKEKLDLKITKRNNKAVSFDKDRIINAINNAMFETGEIDHNLSEQIANDIENEIKPFTKVEDIQDNIVNKLKERDRNDIAKRYSKYRDKKAKEREIKKDLISNKLLSDEFISKYKHTKAPFTPLGEFVYYRTYSRWIPELKRREYWWETAQRAVEYNCSLVPNTTKEEAEDLYDNIFNLRQFLSGRTLFTGGTKASLKYPLSNFNCALRIINDYKAFGEVFYVLMLGTGCGIRVLAEDVEQLAPLRRNIEIINKEYSPIRKKSRQENTSLICKNNTATIIIGDSKEGWQSALNKYFELLSSNCYNNINTIILNYDNVRRKGERLLTFGGRASGHESVLSMFTKIDNLIKNISNDDIITLKSIDCLDICNIVGENVVSGGVRRTSEVGVFDVGDTDILNAKKDLYKNMNGEWVENTEISHRKMSNNSIFYTSKPTREQLHSHLQTLRYNGEPGFINAEAGLKRRSNFKGLNPCCFTGDMRLLTKQGYKTFEELCDKEIELINKDGEISKGSVWCNGEKKIIELQFDDNEIVKCTPDHIFMLDNNEECEAKDLLLKNVKLHPKSKRCSKVIKITHRQKEKVYDFNEPKTHWGIVEGFVVHNCEILLDNQQTCNLTTINVMAFVIDGKLNKEGLIKAQKLSVRAGYRMTCTELELFDWNAKQKRDRLLGCSLTGWQDMVNELNMTREDQTNLLGELREAAHEEMKTIAKEVNGKESLLVTTVKPEGTLSLLPTVSSGVHYSHSPYYIRRVRITAVDPLVKVCEELGYVIKPENGEEWDTCKTKVIEFPVKAPEGRTKYDVSAIEQLENYKMFMKYYVDHNVSITIHVRDNEWDDVEEWIWNNWDDVVAISFLPLTNASYALMPFEAITKEEYEERILKMKPFNPELIQKYEKEEAKGDLEVDPECGTGACGVR